MRQLYWFLVLLWSQFLFHIFLDSLFLQNFSSHQHHHHHRHDHHQTFPLSLSFISNSNSNSNSSQTPIIYENNNHESIYQNQSQPQPHSQSQPQQPNYISSTNEQIQFRRHLLLLAQHPELFSSHLHERLSLLSFPTPDPCSSDKLNPCLHGGHCVSREVPMEKVEYNNELFFIGKKIWDVRCLCSHEYSGLFCNVGPKPCLLTSSFYCMNQGKCILDVVGRERCVCLPGFLGDRCELTYHAH